jgi:hypothetical protein
MIDLDELRRLAEAAAKAWGKDAAQCCSGADMVEIYDAIGRGEAPT